MSKPSNIIKVGQRPEAFSPIKAEFTMPDGSAGCIPDCVFRYRTRSEFAAQVDANVTAAKDEAEAAAGTETSAAFSMTRHVDHLIAADVKHLIQSLQSWGLDEPPSAEVLAQLSDELPAAIRALSMAYRSAIMDGHLGN